MRPRVFPAEEYPTCSYSFRNTPQAPFHKGSTRVCVVAPIRTVPPFSGLFRGNIGVTEKGTPMRLMTAAKLKTGAFPISRSRAHTHRRHGHPLQTVPSAGLIERPQEKNRVDALR